MQTHLNLLIAHAGESTWATGLASSLDRLPLGVHMSRSDAEAIQLAAERRMHLAVFDDALPPRGGLDVVRRIRRLGLELPCLLVSPRPDPRVLRSAIELDVFSVLESENQRDLLEPMILKVAKRFYNVNWAEPGSWN